jgi:hypothetical protein
MLKNWRNDSTYNIISGEEKAEIPVTFSKKMFPDREANRMNPII